MLISSNPKLNTRAFKLRSLQRFQCLMRDLKKKGRVESSKGGMPLEAPTTPLSVTTNVDPSSVTAPNQGTPNIDPAPVKPPNSSNEPISQTSSQATSSNDTGFGVSFMMLSTPASPSDTAFSSENALTNPVTNNSNAVNQSTSFQVQTLNLEPPSSVLPATLSSLNALDISSPQSALDTPIVGLPDPTTVLAPNPTNVPTVGSTPSDSPSTIQAPSSVTSVLPPSIGNIPVGSIDVPALTGEPGVNLFDATDNDFARYMEWKANFERYFSSIIESLIRTHQLTEAKLGDALRNIANVMSVFLIDYTKKYNPSQLGFVTETLSIARNDFKDPLQLIIFIYDYSAAVHLAPSFEPARRSIVNMYAAAKVMHATIKGGELAGWNEWVRLQKELATNPYFNPYIYDGFKKYGGLMQDSIRQVMLEQADNDLFKDYQNVKDARIKAWEETINNAKTAFEIALLIIALIPVIQVVADVTILITSAGVIVVGNLNSDLQARIRSILQRFSTLFNRLIPRTNTSASSTTPISFRNSMSADELQRYEKYWQQYAPKQVTPGITRIDFTRISGRTGRSEVSTGIYDAYGRMIYRVDWTDHMRPNDHSSPHLHELIWLIRQGYKEAVHNFFK